jgi:hypothetical protein
MCMKRLVFLLASLALLSSCGSSNGDSQTPLADTGWDAFDAQDTIDLDTGPSDGGADAVVSADTGRDVQDDVQTDAVIDPHTPRVMDYTVCTSDVDCPINGSRCVLYVPFSHPDMNDVTEVALSDVFDALEPGQGVCTRTCSTDPTVCGDVRWPDERGNPRASSCLLIATGTPPYQLESLDPFVVHVDLEKVVEGQAFAALCMPPFQHSGRAGDFCKRCDVPADCARESACYNMLTATLRGSEAQPGQSFCLEYCMDTADCPMGFSCQQSGSERSVCVPDAGSCTACIDHDQDGFGTGHCGPATARKTAFDCDDTNPGIYYDATNRYHSFPAHCGAFDYGCDGLRDDIQLIGSPQWGSEHCTACGDTCSGSVGGGVLACEIQSNGEPACVVGCAPGRTVCGTDPREGCPIALDDPDYLYFQDADGDGFGDHATAPVFFCTSEEAADTLINAIAHGEHPVGEDGNLRLDCDDADAETYPGAPNFCNGKDNSCSGLANHVDQGVVQVGEPCTIARFGVYGVCTAGRLICREDAGAWGLYCNQVVFPSDEVCDGLDNDCSGSVDDNVPRVGDACETGLAGQCNAGVLTCTPGAVGTAVPLTCQQTVFPALEAPGFDGEDHSCDGFDRYARADGTPLAVFVNANSNNAINAALIEAANASCRTSVAGQSVPCDVFLQAGNHFSTSPIVLQNGIAMYGGLSSDPNTWRVGPTRNLPAYLAGPPPSVITVNIPSGAALGMEGTSIDQPTHLYGVRVVTSSVNMTEPDRFCASNIGFYCATCPGLRLRNVEIQAGAAGPGRAGASGADGRNGSAGLSGGTYDLSWWYVPGGPSPVGNDGGLSSCGYGTHWWCWSDGNILDGFDGFGPRPGPRGQSWSPNGGEGGGGVGASQPVAGVSHYGMFSGTSSVCTPNLSGGVDPTNSHGSGGGGSYVRTIVNITGVYYYSASGGGGGEAGGAGVGGAAGAVSIGMVLLNTPSGMEMTDVAFSGGAGGAGGPGGNGGTGGLGGVGGIHAFTDNWAFGGAAGNGSGGNGGFGGHGGPSIGLFVYNSTLGTNTGVTMHSGSGGMGGTAGMGGPEPGGQVSDHRKGAAGVNGLQGRPGLTCSRYDATGSLPIFFVQAQCTSN